MEPLHPELRSGLKQAHPGLTDADIDRTEELLARRMLLDPQKEREQIARLDLERTELIRRLMPRYVEVVQAFRARRAAPPDKSKRKVVVTPKKPTP